MHHDRSPVMRNGRNMETIRYMRHGTRQTGKLHPLYIGVAAVTVMTFCFAAVKMSGIYGFLIFPDEFAYCRMQLMPLAMTGRISLRWVPISRLDMVSSFFHCLHCAGMR